MPTIRDELFTQNPWWGTPNAIESAEKIRQFEGNPVKWHPHLEPGKGINILRGPRQVGKTTLMDLMIRKLLVSIPSHRILFLSCELVKGDKELYDYISEYLDYARANGGGERYLFIDEVSYVKDWALAIKRLKDSGALNACTLILSGSNAAEIKQGAERLPGREVEGNENFLYPLPFREYLQVTGQWRPEDVIPNISRLTSQKGANSQLFKKLRAYEPHLRELHVAFERYLKTGGFLKPINEQAKGMEPVYETYLRWIERDIAFFGRDIRMAQQVLRAIIEKHCSPTSMLGITKQTDIGNNTTTAQYITLLEDMQVFSQYPYIDISEKKAVWRKEKKTHFIDPFIALACAEWAKTEIGIPCLVEGVVAEHLRRSANETGDEIGYHSSRTGETDMVMVNGSRTFPLEVKWQETINPGDYAGLFKFGHGVLVTKKFLGLYKERYVAIPAPLLLSMLNISPLQRMRYGRRLT